jgi:hypothetical protein
MTQSTSPSGQVPPTGKTVGSLAICGNQFTEAKCSRAEPVASIGRELAAGKPQALPPVDFFSLGIHLFVAVTPLPWRL